MSDSDADRSIAIRKRVAGHRNGDAARQHAVLGCGKHLDPSPFVIHVIHAIHVRLLSFLVMIVDFDSLVILFVRESRDSRDSRDSLSVSCLFLS